MGSTGNSTDRPWVMEGSPDEEGPKDPAARTQAPGSGSGPGPALGLTERDNVEIDSHRHLYVGFHLPGKGKRTDSGHHGRHHHGHSRSSKHGGLKAPQENLRPAPAVRRCRGRLV